jgi:hypothetical protein
MLRRFARLSRLLPALLGLLPLGCGGDGTHHVTGKVNFQGKPVPAGKIYFIPDNSKGNTGPTGYADIKDGFFDTSATGGSGVPPGPLIIAIEGIDPSAKPDKPKRGEEESGVVSEEATGKVLFPRYEVNFEMPKENTTKDIEVPAEAAKGPVNPNFKPGEIIP